MISIFLLEKYMKLEIDDSQQQLRFCFLFFFFVHCYDFNDFTNSSEFFYCENIQLSLYHFQKS